jgi:hypothetical protein
MIPKQIFQSWKTKDLSPEMAEVVERLRKNNPEYSYNLYDDNDCREFLLQHFGVNYANAFDVLIPGAFKCDFWRYAMLYINGGVYLDIDMVPLLPLKEIVPDNVSFVSIVDRTLNKIPGIYQAFIACEPRNSIVLYALQLTFANIVTRRYSDWDMLSISGPGLMAISFNLFLERKNTNKPITPGAYSRNGENVVLYQNKGDYCIDLNNKKIFQNKFDGYDGENYWKLKSYYKDAPRPVSKKMNIWIILLIIAILLIGWILYSRNKN